MISETYKEYLRSPIWQRLRSTRLRIDGHRCQFCGSPLDPDVHHTHYPLELGTENVYTDLITLCRPCHEKVEKAKREYKEHQQYVSQTIQQMARAEDTYDFEKLKAERKAEYERHNDLIRQFIREHKDDDLSNVGKGKRDYCNLDIIKIDFFPWMEDHGEKAEETIDGKYFSGTSKIQEYFRNRRYEIILDMLEKGYKPNDIYLKTNFSMQMISKVRMNPDKAKTLLKKEREEENNA